MNNIYLSYGFEPVESADNNEFSERVYTNTISSLNSETQKTNFQFSYGDYISEAFILKELIKIKDEKTDFAQIDYETNELIKMYKQFQDYNNIYISLIRHIIKINSELDLEKYNEKYILKVLESVWIQESKDKNNNKYNDDFLENNIDYNEIEYYLKTILKYETLINKNLMKEVKSLISIESKEKREQYLFSNIFKDLKVSFLPEPAVKVKVKDGDEEIEYQSNKFSKIIDEFKTDKSLEKYLIFPSTCFAIGINNTEDIFYYSFSGTQDYFDTIRCACVGPLYDKSHGQNDFCKKRDEIVEIIYGSDEFFEKYSKIPIGLDSYSSRYHDLNNDEPLGYKIRLYQDIEFFNQSVNYWGKKKYIDIKNYKEHCVEYDFTCIYRQFQYLKNNSIYNLEMDYTGQHYTCCEKKIIQRLVQKRDQKTTLYIAKEPCKKCRSALLYETASLNIKVYYYKNKKENCTESGIMSEYPTTDK